MTPQLRLGDGLLILAMLVWLSVAVGPWWLGLLVFAGAALVNYVTRQKGEP